ncbi:MAG: glycosyltransferase [Desulfobacteraceae bacterium]|nr:glycosyltransferase [Desulfobacteraceae bacterium]
MTDAPSKQAAPAPRVSVVVPVSERHDDLAAIYRVHRQVLREMGLSCELIFVLDGRFPEAERQLATPEKEPDCTVIRFPRHYGESRALSAGFAAARGELVLTLAAYLQIQPAEIAKLFAELTPAQDMVTGSRFPRRDNWVNRVQSRLFHGLVRRLTGESFQDVSCGVRLLRREVLAHLGLYGDLHRFLPLLAIQKGFKVKEVPLAQACEDCRLRLYRPGVYWRRLLDILSVFFLFKFTQKPLRFFGLLGSGIGLFGLLLAGTTVFQRFFFHHGLANRPLFLIGVLITLVGLQTFFIGLIGEIIIFLHMPEQPRYRIDKLIER